MTKEKAQIKKKHKRRSIFFIMIFIMLYVPSVWNWLFVGSIDTAVINNGILEESFKVKGLFIREEKVIFAPFEGICVLNAGNFEKLPVGYMVANIVKDTEYSLIDMIDKKEREIVERELEENGDKSSIFFKDEKDREKFERQVKRLSDISRNRSLMELDDIREAINSLLYKIGKSLLRSPSKKVFLKSEKEELAKLKNRLKQSQESIFTKEAGLLCYYVDGYEKKLSPDRIEKITPKEIKEILKNYDKPFKIKNGREPFDVEKGHPFAKLVTSIGSYFVFAISFQEAIKIHEGIRLEMKVFGLDRTIRGKIKYISPSYSGKSTVVLYFDKGVEETLPFRKAEAEIVIKKYEGLKVPIKSLLNISDVESTAEIFIVKDNYYAALRKVKILAKDENSAIITNIEGANKGQRIKLYDMYICNPKNIKEGQVINQ